MGEHFSTNFSSWDLAVPGSPSISRLMSPRRVRPSGSLGEDGQAGQGSKARNPGLVGHSGLAVGPPACHEAQSRGGGGGSGLRATFMASCVP